jgi:excisionase family DNA binding protein
MSTSQESDESGRLLREGLRTVEEAREYTRLSRSTLYGLMEAGKLTYTKIGRRRLIPYRALLDLAESGMTEP